MGSTPSKYSAAEIREFLVSGHSNKWLTYGPIDLYVRRAVHSIDGRVIRTFDLANVQIPNISYRGQGAFKALVQHVETLLQDESLRRGIEGIYVENVFDETFRGGLIRMGFEQVRTPVELLPSFYSPLPMPFGRASK